jgi:hypothetical protein
MAGPPQQPYPPSQAYPPQQPYPPPQAYPPQQAYPQPGDAQQGAYAPQAHPAYPGWWWNGSGWVPAPYGVSVYGEKPTGPYERMSNKATIATVFYVIAVGAAVFAVYANLHRYSVISNLSDAFNRLQAGDLTTSFDAATADNADNLVRASTITFGVAFALGFIALLVFLHGSQRNNRALGARAMRFTPGWVVGWFLIPLANLVMGWVALNEVEQVSRNPRGVGAAGTAERSSLRVAPIVAALAIATSIVIVCAVVGANLTTTINQADITSVTSFHDYIDKVHAHDALYTGVFALYGVIAILWVVLVRRIAANQQAAARQAGVIA